MNNKLKAFIQGMGSVFNIFPSRKLSDEYLLKHNRNGDTQQIDAEAISSDWKQVGDDMRKAMQENKEDVQSKEG